MGVRGDGGEGDVEVSGTWEMRGMWESGICE